MKKLIITDKIVNFCDPQNLYNLNVENHLKIIDEAICAARNKNYFNFRFQDFDGWDSSDIYIIADREENDEEAAARIDREEKKKQNKKDKLLKQKEKIEKELANL